MASQFGVQTTLEIRKGEVENEEGATYEIHLSFWYVFLRVQEVFVKSLIIPLNSGRLVGWGVNVTGYSTSGTTKKTIQVGSLLGSSALAKD